MLNKFKNSNSVLDITFLENLVNIDSQTRNFEGVSYIQKEVELVLKFLGFQTEIHESELEKEQKLLVGTRVGSSSESIIFVCHADTACKLGTKGKFRIEGDHALGAGIADNKAGILIGLKALDKFLKTDDQHKYTIHFVCSPNEEEGSLGFHKFFEKYAENSKYVFGLEPSLIDGSIISSRNGNRWYRIKFKGIKAHSGRLEGEYHNAAHDLIQFSSALMKFNEKKEGSAYFNISTISGGKGVFNIMCGYIELLVDLRFSCHGDRDEFHSLVEYLLGSYDAEYEIEDDCPGMKKQVHSQIVIDNYLLKLNKSESGIRESHTGGAADINYFNNNQNICIDGLGAKGGRLHRKDEYIDIKSLETRSDALACTIDYVSKNL